MDKILSSRESGAKESAITIRYHTGISLTGRCPEIMMVSMQMKRQTNEVDDYNAEVASMRPGLEKLGRNNGNRGAAPLSETRKMVAVSTLAEGVAHEMNNVLATIIGFGSMLAEEIAVDDPKHLMVQEILSAADRGHFVATDLAAFVARPNGGSRPLSLNETVEAAIGPVSLTVSNAIILEHQLDPDLALVECDPKRMMNVLTRLCTNAADAISSVGTITISTRNLIIGSADDSGDTRIAPGRYVELRVADDGDGMDARTLARAFEPFFTTKDVGDGAGLGLSAVYGIVNAYGGTVDIASGVNEGTTVTILFPACAAAATRFP